MWYSVGCGIQYLTKYLSQVLNTTTLNLTFHVKTLPGARVRRVALKVIAELAYYNDYHLIILLAGINDVSKLCWHPSRHAVPRFNSAREIEEAIDYEMKWAASKVTEYTATPVIFASLAGMDLLAVVL